MRLPLLLNSAAILFGLLLGVASPSRARQNDFLPAEKAYQYEVSADGARLLVSWIVEPGYYLARSRMGFESATPGVVLGKAMFPAGEPHRDEFFGDGEIYRGTATFEIPYRVTGTRPARVALKLKWQGCADAGLCYPPTVWTTQVSLPAATPNAKGAATPSSAQNKDGPIVSQTKPGARAAAGLSAAAAAASSGNAALEFKRVHDLTELDRALAAARQQRKAALIDFSADWCAPCKKMEKETFSDVGVRASLSRLVLLRADVTDATDTDAALLKRFKSPGPPLIALFDAQGKELPGCQVTGFVPATKFRAHVDACIKNGVPPK